MREVKFPKIALTFDEPKGTECSKCGMPEIVTTPLTAQDMLLQVLNIFHDGRGQVTNPTMKDIEARLSLREKIADAKGSVLLESDEWGLLDEAVKLRRWPWRHEDVLKVCHAVTEAKEVEVEAKVEEKKG